MILNQKDFNNFRLPLTKQLEFHLNTPFLLFKMEARNDSKDEADIGTYLSLNRLDWSKTSR